MARREFTPIVYAHCSIANCQAKSYARGWCRKHYSRWQRHGDPQCGRQYDGAALNWLRDRIDFEGNDCLLWPFSTRGRGYGQVWQGGRMRSAHRLMCELAHGQSDNPRLEAAHSCGNGHLGCVHPRHLHWATSVENKTDMLRHGTALVGEKNPQAKLSEDDVRSILRLRGAKSLREIAKMFSVSKPTVHSIHTGRNWGWLND